MSYQKPQIFAENPIKTLSMGRCWSQAGCPGLKGY